MIKIKRLSSFFLFLLHLMIVLAEEQATDHTSGEFNCSSDSGTVKIQFFPKKLDYNDAGRFCLKRNQKLLPYIMYQNVKECILYNIKNISVDQFWIADKKHIVKKGTETNNINSNSDNVNRSVLCVQQDMMFKTFNLTVQGNISGPIDLDLLSSACETEHVFNVTKGANMTLKYEATGIPAPIMTVKQIAPNLKDMKSINSGTIMITTIPLDTSGSENIFTCKDEKSNTSMSVSITVKYNSTDVLPYTIVKVEKLTCQTNAIDKNSNTDDARDNNTGCQGMVTSNCGDSLKIDTTTMSTNDIDNSDNDSGKRGGKETTFANHGNDLYIAIPVALVTVAVVLAACCILCIFCGVLLYRKRGRIIRKFSKFDTGHNNIQNNIELEKIALESRRFINNTSTMSHDDHELYSTVKTMPNVYANITPLLQVNCSDEQKELFNSSNGSCSCDHMQPARYASDGLIYVTAEHTGKGNIVKPARKVKPQERVEYTTVDIIKTEKLRLKKEKRLASKMATPL